jgi:hypothetical protein
LRDQEIGRTKNNAGMGRSREHGSPEQLTQSLHSFYSAPHVILGAICPLDHLMTRRVILSARWMTLMLLNRRHLSF